MKRSPSRYKTTPKGIKLAYTKNRNLLAHNELSTAVQQQKKLI